MKRKRQSEHPVAIVTGAGKRLGKHIAIALASNGYNVVVNYHNSRAGALTTVREIVSMGRAAVAIKADVSKGSHVRNMVSKTITRFGRIDLLVNSSSVFIEASLPDISEDVWDTTFNINLKGYFLCTQAVIPYLLKQSHGVIINIASLGGIQAWSQHLPYSVSKAGVIMLTKCAAKALAPSISVNAIAPGTIIMKGEERDAPKHIKSEKIPMQRHGQPLDITDAVVFLATKAPYMTGQIISIDGGRSIP